MFGGNFDEQHIDNTDDEEQAARGGRIKPLDGDDDDLMLDVDVENTGGDTAGVPGPETQTPALPSPTNSGDVAAVPPAEETMDGGSAAATAPAASESASAAAAPGPEDTGDRDSSSGSESNSDTDSDSEDRAPRIPAKDKGKRKEADESVGASAPGPIDEDEMMPGPEGVAVGEMELSLANVR